MRRKLPKAEAALSVPAAKQDGGQEGGYRLCPAAVIKGSAESAAVFSAGAELKIQTRKREDL